MLVIWGRDPNFLFLMTVLNSKVPLIFLFYKWKKKQTQWNEVAQSQSAYK